MDFRKWVVISVADLDKVNYRDPYVITTNAQTARQNIAGNQAVISYHDHEPLSIQAIASKGSELDRTEYNALMNTQEWYVDVDLGV